MHHYFNLKNFILLWGFVLFLVIAFTNVGYYHADEHFQIIEFAQLMLKNTNSVMTWEYDQQIRPSLQPFLCSLIFKPLNLIGINDPYLLTFLLRVLSSIFGFLVIKKFYSISGKKIEEKYKLPYLVLCLFLWMIPFAVIRFSSETYSGLFFMLAICYVLEEKNRNFFLVGVFLALSFFFRFQMAFAFIGLLANLVFFQRLKFKEFAHLAGGFLIILVLNIVLDRLFYGNIVFTPYNYFYYNIIEDIASNFGTEDFNFYFNRIISLPSRFIGTLLVLSVVLMLFSKTKDVILWSVLSFIIFHSIIPHKEIRFLFPIIFFAPYVLINGVMILFNFIQNKILRYLLKLYLLTVFLFINSLCLFVLAFKPPGDGFIPMIKYIEQNYVDKPVYFIKLGDINPYNPWGLNNQFYVKKNVIFIENFDEGDLKKLKQKSKNAYLLFTADKYQSERPIVQKLIRSSIPKFKVIPDWMDEIDQYYNGLNEAPLTLYELTYKD